MRIRRVQSQTRELNQVQYNVAQVLEPLSQQPLAYGNLLKSVVLAVGDNNVNHLLSVPLTGWIVTRKRANSDIFDKQDTNQTPQLTLVLNSSAAVTVDLFVF